MKVMFIGLQYPHFHKVRVTDASELEKLKDSKDFYMAEIPEGFNVIAPENTILIPEKKEEFKTRLQVNISDPTEEVLKKFIQMKLERDDDNLLSLGKELLNGQEEEV